MGPGKIWKSMVETVYWFTAATPLPARGVNSYLRRPRRGGVTGGLISMARRKIALIGGGQIGGTLALMAAQRGLGDVVLYDVGGGMPQGKGLDIMGSRPLGGYGVDLKGTNNYQDRAGADVVIVTAGFPRKPGMSRDDLLNKNIEIMRDVASNVKTHCPNAFVIVISNPLDAMVYAMKKITNFPRE